MRAFYANFAGSDIVRTNPVRVDGRFRAIDFLGAADMQITYGYRSAEVLWIQWGYRSTQ